MKNENINDSFLKQLSTMEVCDMLMGAIELDLIAFFESALFAMHRNRDRSEITNEIRSIIQDSGISIDPRVDYDVCTPGQTH